MTAYNHTNNLIDKSCHCLKLLIVAIIFLVCGFYIKILNTLSRISILQYIYLVLALLNSHYVKRGGRKATEQKNGR
jgi:hypothetical protein